MEIKNQNKKAYLSPEITLHPVCGQLMQNNSVGKEGEHLSKGNYQPADAWEE